MRGGVSERCRSPPLHQGEERNGQLAALLGQPILEPRRALAVGDALEDAFFDEGVEAIGEDVSRDIG
jgi:hypothetical protein